MNQIAEAFCEGERKERGIIRNMSVQTQLLAKLQNELDIIDRKIEQVRNSRKRATFLEHKLQKIEEERQLDIERSFLRSTLFQHEDIINEYFEARLASMRK